MRRLQYHRRKPSPLGVHGGAHLLTDRKLVGRSDRYAAAQACSKSMALVLLVFLDDFCLFTCAPASCCL